MPQARRRQPRRRRRVDWWTEILDFLVEDNERRRGRGTVGFRQQLRRAMEQSNERARARGSYGLPDDLIRAIEMHNRRRPFRHGRLDRLVDRARDRFEFFDEFVINMNRRYRRGYRRRWGQPSGNTAH
jgi:hypothetical protein